MVSFCPSKGSNFRKNFVVLPIHTSLVRIETIVVNLLKRKKKYVRIIIDFIKSVFTLTFYRLTYLSWIG